MAKLFGLSETIQRERENLSDRLIQTFVSIKSIHTFKRDTSFERQRFELILRLNFSR